MEQEALISQSAELIELNRLRRNMARLLKESLNSNGTFCRPRDGKPGCGREIYIVKMKGVKKYWVLDPEDGGFHSLTCPAARPKKEEQL